LWLDDASYKKVGNGWVVQQAEPSDSLNDLLEPARYFIETNWGPPDALEAFFSAWTDVQEAAAPEVVNGLATRHFMLRLDPDQMQKTLTDGTEVHPPTGLIQKLDLWIDPQTAYLQKLTYQYASQEPRLPPLAPGNPLTPTGTPEPAFWMGYILIFTRHNDPTITIPAPTPPQSPTPGSTIAPSPTPVLVPASTADLALIRQAYTATDGLTRFHLSEESQDNIPNPRFSWPTKVELDYVAPAQAHLSGALFGRTLDILAREGQSYRNEDGRWVAQTFTDTYQALVINNASPPSGPLPDPAALMRDYFLPSGGEFAAILAAGGEVRTVQGEEILNGVRVQRFILRYDATRLAQLGQPVPATPGLPMISVPITETLWIDEATGFIQQVQRDTDLSAVGAAPEGTPESGVPTPTVAPHLVSTIIVVISRQNDATIVIPSP
jgi:hypothetical protein